MITLEKLVFGLILVVIFIATFFAGFFGYQQYNSYTYNNLLNQSDNNWVQAKGLVDQVNITGNSYDTNIQYLQNAENLTRQAINETQQMSNVAPDDSTYAYAQIQLAEYQNALKLEDQYLKVNEDLKSSGLLSAAAMVQNNTQSINATGQNIIVEQNQLIQLVNSNPSLNKRLVNVLGQSRVNQIMSPIQGYGVGTI